MTAFLGLAALLVLAAACQPRESAEAVESTPISTPAPTVASLTYTPVPAPTTAPLVGLVTRATIEAYPGWQPKADSYAPEAGAIATIKQGSNDVRAILFLATWDEASRREVPRLYRVMDEAGMAADSVPAFALDESLKDVGGVAEGFGVQAVPTLILFKGGREIGRMVNWPDGVLEGAMAQIITDGNSLPAEGPGAEGIRCH